MEILLKDRSIGTLFVKLKVKNIDCKELKEYKGAVQVIQFVRVWHLVWL